MELAIAFDLKAEVGNLAIFTTKYSAFQLKWYPINKVINTQFQGSNSEIKKDDAEFKLSLPQKNKHR